MRDARTVILDSEDLEEIEGVLLEVVNAAEADSNDAEIDALREAADWLAQIAGLVMPEPNPVSY